jgi:cell division protein FtsQ
MTAPAAPPSRRRVVRIAVAVVVVVLLASAPWVAPRALSSLAFFRVRKVEIRGATYIPASEVLRRLHLDSTASVFDDQEPLLARLRAHPQVRDVEIDRRLPATLIVRVRENMPVALIPVTRGFVVVDGQGRQLPIDPSATALDLPILAARDTALARLLAELRASYPSLFAKVSEIRREGRNELLVRLADARVRALANVSADRLADITPVEADLARRHLRVAELDLRYRDQVIARLP